MGGTKKAIFPGIPKRFEEPANKSLWRAVLTQAGTQSCPEQRSNRVARKGAERSGSKGRGEEKGCGSKGRGREAIWDNLCDEQNLNSSK